MRAKMALGGRVIFRVNVNRIVGTGLHAGFAANAAIGTKIDNPIFALIHRSHGTNGDAGRFLAVIATRDLKNTPRVRKDALLNVFHPGSVDADGNFIFSFAGDCAGVASDAFAIIDYEAVFHWLK
jgi:hypothetical protein